MSQDVKRFTHHGVVIRIVYDDQPPSPREWSNLGTMVCWTRKYALGDEHRYLEPSDFLLDLLDEKAVRRSDCWDNARLFAEASKRAIILPLYLYDHSGITMATSPFSCPWDSGQVGWIYVTLKKVREEYDTRAVTKAVRAKAVECLEQEVSTYAEFLEGQVFGYILETEDGEEIDSLWGVYGYDYCIAVAKNLAEHFGKEIADKKATTIAEQIQAERPDLMPAYC